MSNLLQFNKSDFLRFFGSPEAQTQNFLSVNSLYPYSSIPWTAENAATLGVGVLQSPVPKFSEANQNSVLVSKVNYFNSQFWAGTIQLALTLPGITDPGAYPLLDDGLFANSAPNKTRYVSLTDYTRELLSPKSSSPSGATAWPINEGPFDPDRLIARNDFSVSAPLQLPSQQSLTSGKYIGIFPLIGPRGFVPVGHFILSNLQANGTAGPVQNQSGTNLLFCWRDARFTQPPITNKAYPFNNLPAGTNLIAGSIYSKAIQEFNASETQLQNTSYSYSSIGNLFFNKVTPFLTDPTFDSYPWHFPWSLNVQLFRYFPTGPDGLTQQFTNFSGTRLLFTNLAGWGTPQNSDVIPSGKSLHPIYHTSLIYPQTSGYTAINISFSPTPAVVQALWPVFVPVGLKALLTCCTGQYIPDVSWNWSSFTPFPPGVTDPTWTMPVATCRAGNWSWNYKPLGTDCNKITSAFCDSTLPMYKGPNCACYNVDAMLKGLGIPVPATDSSQAALSQNLSANIACYYVNCSSVGEALKNTGQVPVNGSSCPPTVNCIISNNTISGDATLINNCGTNSSDNNESRSRLVYIMQILFFVIAGFFLVIGTLLLLLRRHRKRTNFLQYDSANSLYDIEDYDDEDSVDDYTKAFSI